MKQLKFLCSLIFLLMTHSAYSADPYAKGTFNVQIYGGILYEPRYCDLSGPLSMETCAMTNLNLAEDFLFRVINENYSANENNIKRIEIVKQSESICAIETKRTKKISGDGSLVQVVRWSCLRREYHNLATQIINEKLKLIHAN